MSHPGIASKIALQNLALCQDYLLLFIFFICSIRSSLGD